MPQKRNASLPFRTVLIAADFSDSSIAACRMACALARPRSTRFIVLHVVEPPSAAEQALFVNEYGAHIPLGNGRSPEHESIEDRLGHHYACDSAAAVDYVVREGLAREEILRTAQEQGCDLIVMGTHGRTGLRRLLVGSVAEAVLRGARCPVLALRSPTPAPRTVEAGLVILHPTDFSERSDLALQLACTLAEQTEGRLIVVHVAPDESIARGMREVAQSSLIYPDELKDVRDRLTDLGFRSPVETLVRAGDPAAEILSAAEETGCGLIVMGSHGRTGLGRLLVGSVAEAVLHGARCPVLIIRVPLPEVPETTETQPPAAGLTT